MSSQHASLDHGIHMLRISMQNHNPDATPSESEPNDSSGFSQPLNDDSTVSESGPSQTQSETEHQEQSKAEHRPIPFIKCPDVWHIDGDIVLRGDTSLLFRVRKETLSSSSLVFADLFDLPQPDEEVLDEETWYDGCPIVQLYDPADHLQHFLKGLHDTSYQINVHSNRGLRLAVGVLELSTKYETSELRERVASWLGAIYPSTLGAYRTRWESWPKEPSEQFDLQNIALVANAARTTKTLTLLPSSLLHYLEQFGRDLGAIIDAHDAGLALGTDNYEADLPLLMKDNLSSILKARSRILFFARKHIYGFAFYSRPLGAGECALGKNKACALSKQEWVEKVEKQSLDGWFAPIGQKVEMLKMCAKCKTEATKVFDRELEVLWDRLPEMFDLVNWMQLARTSKMI